MPTGGTVQGREPFQISDLLQQASESVELITDTVEALRGDAERAVKQIALTAERSHALVEDVRPDITAIARNGNRITADTRDDHRQHQRREGHDRQARQRRWAVRAGAADCRGGAGRDGERARGVGGGAPAIADFRSTSGPTQGLMSDMRSTLGQAREATADLADNMEAMKRNFLLRGFFNRAATSTWTRSLPRTTGRACSRMASGRRCGSG